MPRRRSFRRSRRAARSFVRRTVVNMGTIHSKRVRVEGSTIPDISSIAYDNPLTIDLLECTEAQNEETISDGTNIATAPIYSRLVGMKLDVKIRGTVNDPNVIRWILYKNEDQDFTAATAMSNFHNSDDTVTANAFRGKILAKGFFLLNQSSGISSVKIFAKRQTLRRLGKLRENDRIRLIFAMNAAATTNPLVYIMGTLYVKTAP